jgi:hypothetical protein
MKSYLFVFYAIYVSASAIAAEVKISPAVRPVSVSAASNHVQNKLVDQILKVSGMKESLQRLPEQIVSGFKQSIADDGISPEEQRELLKIYKEAYPKNGFVNRVRDALNINYDEGRYTHLLQLLSTPLSQRMVKLESVEPSPAEFRNYISQVAAQPLSPDRILLIQRMDSATRTSAMLGKMTISSIESNAMAMADDCNDNAEKIKRMLDEQRPDIEKSTRSSAQVMLAFTYRDVTDADLNEYLKINEDADSKWVQDFVQAAIEEQFNWGIEKETKGMKQFVQSHKPKKTMFAPKCE